MFRLPFSHLTPQQALDLAMTHHRAGRLVEAEEIYRQLMALSPGNTDILHLLGLLAYDAGNCQPALELMQQAIVGNPRVSRYYSNLAPLLLDTGRFDEAVAVCGRAIQLQPDNASAHYNLGLARAKQRQFEAAVAAYETALKIDPNHRRAVLGLGTALAGAGQNEAAIAVYREALRQWPGEPSITMNLGTLYRDQGQLDEAIAAYRAVIALEPDNALAHNNLGVALKDRGELEAAVAAMRRSLELNPHQAAMHSNLIFAMHFVPGLDSSVIAAEERCWNDRHATPLRNGALAHPNERSPDRRLRIGYVSPDLRDHVVGRSFWPVFEQHDRERLELVCYSDGTADALTKRFSSRADQWRVVSGWSDERVAAQIRSDAVDILVDLAQHTAHNRLLVFARKPAPVQVAWLAYAGGTGLEAIDYRLTDVRMDPVGKTPRAPAEKPFHLPDVWCCYDPMMDAPGVDELPMVTRGYVTFGSQNQFCKHNERALELWVRILHEVRDSRLAIVCPPGQARERTTKFFAARGIAEPRIEFLDQCTRAEYLRRYNAIDIALDPFPFNGMTTTCDTLWMGVPVVALTGDTPVSRASFSLLSNLGLRELASSCPDEYVRIAVALAKDRARLAELRTSLRSRMEASPLLDAKSLARNVEAAYRTMWRRWCAS